MKNKCFDIGGLQTFVDGELGAERVEELVKHLSMCDECTLLVADLETENDAAFSVIGSELDVLVPTERLRTKVFASIEDLESNGRNGFWARLNASLGLTGLALRPGAAFAGILFLIAFGAVGMRYWNPGSPAGQNIAKGTPSPVEIVTSESPALLPAGIGTTPGETEAGPTETVDLNDSNPVVDSPAKAVKASQPSRKRGFRKKSVVRPAVRLIPAVLPSAELDAEDGYLRTIATLNRTVDQNKDYVLRPSERVVFERDLAVVNDAIKKMKGEVRQDPGNTAAREVLRSSYKNKIDLLNSVAERSETVASLD